MEEAAVNLKHSFEVLCNFIMDDLKNKSIDNVKKKLNRSKFWLIMDLYNNGDYFTFSYTANSPQSVRWMFTPDFNIDTKYSKKKHSFESYIKRNMIDIALELEVSKERLEVTAQKWKGFELKMDSDPMDWNNHDIMQQYAAQTVNFIQKVKPYIEAWYQREGFVKVEQFDHLSQFQPLTNETGQYITQKVKERIGQEIFRSRVLNAYHNRCAITGETCAVVLEAAHIQPYVNENSNHIQNGIALRADIHHLFDTGYITITNDYHVQVSPNLISRDYQQLHLKKLFLPDIEEHLPSKLALKLHREVIFRGEKILI